MKAEPTAAEPVPTIQFIEHAVKQKAITATMRIVIFFIK